MALETAPSPSPADVKTLLQIVFRRLAQEYLPRAEFSTPVSNEIQKEVHPA
jgi:hypothetical protein